MIFLFFRVFVSIRFAIFGVMVPVFSFSQNVGSTSSRKSAVPSSLGNKGDVNDPLDRFYKRYAPTSDYLQSIDPAVFEVDYKVILQMIKDLEIDLIPALVVQMDNGAWGVFREYARDSISSKYRFSGQEKSYFPGVASTVAFSSHLRDCTRILEKAIDRFEQIKDSLGYVGFSEEEVLDTEYRINRGLGILYSFSNSPGSLKKAKGRFDFILNGKAVWKKPEIRPIVKDKDQISEACRYNSSISYVLSKMYDSDDVQRLFYKREELFYLWNLVGNTIDNPQFRDSQYMRICKDFFPVMDFDGARFSQHYGKYIGILGLEYSKESSEKEPVKNPQSGEG